MVDLKYTQHRIECFTTIKKRLADMKPGETILGADLMFIALGYGFGYKVVGEIVDTYKEMGIVEVIYEDGRAHKITKPLGEVFEHV